MTIDLHQIESLERSVDTAPLVLRRDAALEILRLARLGLNADAHIARAQSETSRADRERTLRVAAEARVATVEEANTIISAKCEELRTRLSSAEEVAAHAETAARLERALDEMVAIEMYLVEAGIESPDAMTPAGADAPNRILGMVQDLHDAQSRDVVAQKVRAERAEDALKERREEIRKLVARVDRAVEMFGAERERAEANERRVKAVEIDRDAWRIEATGTNHFVAAEFTNERLRQVVDEGWSNAHDDEHESGELARAAAAYAARAISLWPFEGEPKFKDRRRDLIRAGALLLAEVARIDRAAFRAAKREATGGNDV